MNTIVITHASTDASFVSDLAISLEAFDLHIMAISEHRPFRHSHDETLQRCDLLIVVISPDAIVMPEVRADWRLAHASNIPIVSVIWYPAISPDAHILKRSVSFYGKPFSDSFDTLLNMLLRCGIYIAPQATWLAQSSRQLYDVPSQPATSIVATSSTDDTMQRLAILVLGGVALCITVLILMQSYAM
ncbi:MAG: TIR domain-containing protein [Chloroflexota bacterium]